MTKEGGRKSIRVSFKAKQFPNSFQLEPLPPQKKKPNKKGTTLLKLLLRSLDRLPILTRDNLDLLRFDHLVGFHFETWIFNDERPDVVAQTVCAEVAFECRFRFDLFDHDIR